MSGGGWAGRGRSERVELRDVELLHGGVRLRLINGAADPNSGAHMVRAFLKHQPHADVVSLKALGHWPHIQDPLTVALHIVQFRQGGAD